MKIYCFRHLLCLWLVSTSFSAGYDDEIAWPTLVLTRTTLTKEVALDNCPEIYSKIEERLCQEGMLKTTLPDLSWVHINVAWASNPRADTKSYKIVLHQGITVMKAIQVIAEKRDEVISDQRNYVLIRMPGSPLGLKSYQIKSEREVKPSTAKSGLVRDIVYIPATIIPPGHTNLLQVDGDTFEQFIRVTLSKIPDLNSSPKSPLFKIDDQAKPELIKVSLVGQWVYDDLLNAVCALTDLRWTVDGDSIRLGKKSSILGNTIE